MNPILLFIDVEPDGFFIEPNQPLPWSGYELAAEAFQLWREQFQAETGRSAEFNWALRIDHQVEHTYGHSDWALRNYGEGLHQLKKAGDGLGIHTHAYRYLKAQDGWIEDYGNQDWVNQNVRQATQLFVQHFQCRPDFSSMGADWINHETIKQVNQLGIPCETTPVARLPPYPFSQLGAYSGQRTDCRQLQARCYHPDPQDFRLQNSDEVMDLFVLPLSSTRPPAAKHLLRNAVKRLRGKALHHAIVKLYLDCPFSQLKTQLTRLENSQAEYLTFMLGSRKFTRAKSLEAMQRNMDYMIRSARARDLDFLAVPRYLASQELHSE